MVDREKVIGHLGILRTWCAVNPKYGVALSIEDYDKAVGWLDDAISLLKAQEPVRPVSGLWDRDIPLFNCGACGGEIGADGIAKYCFHCGRKVKWE